MRKSVLIAGIATAVALMMSGCADRTDNGAAGYTVESPTSTAVLGTFDPLATYPPSAAPAQPAPSRPSATRVPATASPATTATAPGAQNPGNPTAVDAEKFAVGSQYPPAYEFFSPTGNVDCNLNFYDAASITCTAKDGGTPAGSAACPQGQAHAINLDASGTRQVCLPPNDLIGNLVLNYGQVITTHGATCKSDEATGITCQLGERGFTLSRDLNRTF